MYHATQKQQGDMEINMMSQIANLMIAQQELAHAKNKGLTDEAMAAVIIAQSKIVEAIRECEKEIVKV